MANIKSSKKRILIGKRRQDENKGKKAALLTAIKKFRAMVANKDFEKATETLPVIFGLIDSSESHGRLHKNNANRKKSRLAQLLSKAEKAPVQEVVAPVVAPAKVEEKKVEPIVEVKVEAEKPVKKTTAKKPTATKKSAEKKVEVKAEEKAEKPAKKTATKKPAAKKIATKKEA